MEIKKIKYLICLALLLAMAFNFNSFGQKRPTPPKIQNNVPKQGTNKGNPQKGGGKPKGTNKGKPQKGSGKPKGTNNTTQQSPPKTNLSVSPTNLSFNENGGIDTITIDANANWNIGKPLADCWVHVSQIGKKQLKIIIDPNPNRESRSDYFTIVSGDKLVKVEISQARRETQLAVSNDNLYFSSSGETKFITIDSDGEDWYIDINTKSWGHLSKYGDILYIKVDPNTSTSERKDYFTIKSGGNTKNVHITQNATSYSSTTSTSNNYEYSRYKEESWWKGRVSFGIEGQGSVYASYKPWKELNEELFYSFGAGIVLRFGKYSDFLNLTVGCRWMRLGYNNEGNKVNFGNHIVIPVNPKFNLFYMGASKFYIGGGFEYGFGLKKMPNFMDFNTGIGVNSRHVDWYIFYKQFMKCKGVALFNHIYKKHIGTSITVYF